MSTHVIKGDIVFECDACLATLETYTSNFDAALNRLTRERWKAYRKRNSPTPRRDWQTNNQWEHRCVGCQQTHERENARAHGDESTSCTD